METVNRNHNHHSKSFCNLHDNYEVFNFVVSLLLSSLGVVCTVISIILSSLNVAVHPSIRGILISYSTANFIGTLILTFDILVTVCYNESVQIGVIITVSIFLSLFHIMFLLLAEYQIITSVVKQSISSFSGLIVSSWIISSCIGCTFIVISMRNMRIMFIFLYVAAIIAIIVGYASIINKSKRRTRMISRYEETFLDVNNFRSKIVKRYWKLKYFAVILISYVIFASPWICKQIHGGTFVLHALHQKFFADSFVLMIYLLNFYVPSAIIVYLWYKKIKSEKLMRILYEFAKQTERSASRKNIPLQPLTLINLSQLKRGATRRAALRRNVSIPDGDRTDSLIFPAGCDGDGDGDGYKSRWDGDQNERKNKIINQSGVTSNSEDGAEEIDKNEEMMAGKLSETDQIAPIVVIDCYMEGIIEN